jgi:membrane fusion protein (multidrug efflux system)
MFLRVELLRHDVTALMVPEQAIVPEQSRQFVFVVGEGGMVAKRQVRIGRRRPGQVEVVDGVAAGEDVVVEGTQKAQDGARVQIIRRMEVAQ